MSCPRCGNTQYRLIARGLAECTGFVPHATGAHPSGAMGPTHAMVPCGRRFQVPAAVERFRAAAAAFPKAVEGEDPELAIVHYEELAKHPGYEAPCPQHGPACAPRNVSRLGRFSRRVHVTWARGAWLLRHRCVTNGGHVHEELYGGGRHRATSTRIELLVISSLGELMYGETSELPVDFADIHNSHAWTADAVIERYGAEPLNELADRIERLLAGERRLGSTPCEPGDRVSL
jgi:hypothetical protein